MNERKYHQRTGKYPALLMMHVGKWEIQRHAPANFYLWTKKARVKYLKKRWPGVTWVGNGIPWSCRGSHDFSL